MCGLHGYFGCCYSKTGQHSHPFFFGFRGYFFSFRKKKCCCSIHGSAPCSADASPYVSGFLRAITVFPRMRLKLMFFWSKWNSWACITHMAVHGSAEMLWLWFDDLGDHAEACAVRMAERGCLPVSSFFFFSLNMFSSIFLLYSFHFLIWSLQGGGKKL